MCRVISFIASGEDCGKSSIVECLAKCLAAKNYKVCVFDGYFAFNRLALQFDKNNSVDLKEYLLKNCGLEDVINKHTQNLFFIKTNSSSFDYSQNTHLIEDFIEKLRPDFDFVLIDLNFYDRASRELFLSISSECNLILTPDVASVVAATKIISYIKRYKNITNIKVTLNKLKVISGLKDKCLNERDVAEMINRQLLFVFPYFYKNNPFSKPDGGRLNDKFLQGFCLSVINNRRVYVEYEQKYFGFLGRIRRRIYEKFE